MKKSNYNQGKKNNIVLIITVLIIFAIGFILYKVLFKKAEPYTVVNGYVEKIADTQGYIIKRETVIPINNENVAVPLAEQNERVRITQPIAIYRNNKYQEYLNKVNEMDKQIEMLIKDLPPAYSNDVSEIDKQISLLVKQSKQTTSYIKMQEYKTKLDNLSNKRVSLLGDLSPSGSKIRELIEQRTKIEEDYKKNSDNIKANVAGCVTYKLDSLEQIVNIDNILSYNTDKLDEIMTKYNNEDSNDFGIKIIDNYLAYIFVKVSSGENDKYIKQGNTYTLRLIDKSSGTLTAALSKIIEKDNNKYCIFKITNGIENLIDIRATGIEIVWTRRSGLAVPLDAIKKDESHKYDYVIAIKNGDYQTIPIKVDISTDSICIVSNFDQNEKEKLGINDSNTLKIYDQLVVKE